MQAIKPLNIFARELEAILASRGIKLGKLDDLTTIHIHRERVRRLQQSLSAPRFHTLPPEELEGICAVFNLTTQEVALLKAAILAAAIEGKLMDRINQDDAFMAAEQLLPLLKDAILAHDGETLGLGRIKAGDQLPAPAPVAPHKQFEAALKLLDSAFIALNLAFQVVDSPRVDWARDAQMNFRAAIRLLDQLNGDLCETDDWRVWRAEAQRGLEQAEDMLSGA